MCMYIYTIDYETMKPTLRITVLQTRWFFLPSVNVFSLTISTNRRMTMTWIFRVFCKFNYSWKVFIREYLTRENASWSGISTYLQDKKLACQTLMDAVQRQEIPGAEMNDRLTGSQSISILFILFFVNSLSSRSHRETWCGGPDGGCTHHELLPGDKTWV